MVININGIRYAQHLFNGLIKVIFTQPVLKL
jgi:hypothetical protein